MKYSNIYQFSISYCKKHPAMEQPANIDPDLEMIQAQLDLANGWNEQSPCELCGKLFRQRRNMLVHLNRAHLGKGPRTVSCSECDYKGSDKDAVRRHMATSHGGNPDSVECETCRTTVESKRALKQHIIRRHRTSRVECLGCSRTYHSKGAMQVHLNNVHLKKRYPCETCGDIFKTPGGRTKHIKLVHLAAELFECVKCDYKSHTKYSIQKHQTTVHASASAPRHPCSDCGETFKTIDNLRQHRASVHLGKISACKLCSKKFPSERSAAAHRTNVHDDKTIFVCHYCEVELSSTYSLARHIESAHQKSDTFACKFCPKTFQIKQDMVLHSKKH